MRGVAGWVHGVAGLGLEWEVLTMAPLTMAPLTMAPLTMAPLTMALLTMALPTMAPPLPRHAGAEQPADR